MKGQHMLRSGRRLGFLAGGLLLTVAIVGAALWVAWREPAVSSEAQGAPQSEGGTMPAAQPPAGRTVPPPDEVAVDEPAPYSSGSVGVALNYAGWEQASDAVEASGFVSGVVEDGGTCRVTLTRGDETAVAETRGLADATTTVCPSVVLAGAELSAGTWTAVLSYESGTSTGVSVPLEVEVPSR
jgi:hypothetical protein